MGVIFWTYAKKCKELCIDKFYFKIFYQNHINKVVDIVFVAEYFDITLDNGYIVKKLPFIHVQGINKAQREAGSHRYCRHVPVLGVKFCNEPGRKRAT